MTAKRSFLLGAGGFLAVTAGQRYGYPGAGPLACIVSSFVAGTGWKWRTADRNRRDRPTAPSGPEDDGPPPEDDAVETLFEHIWIGLQPVLFASIGTEIKFELLAGGDIIARGLVVLLVGLIVSDVPRSNHRIRRPDECRLTCRPTRDRQKNTRFCLFLILFSTL